MLDFGSFRSQTCGGVDRRAFLKLGLAAPFAMAGAPLGGAAQPANGPHVRAKSVLLVWLWGAPSHLDTFDPKPNAPAEFRGPFSTIATRNPGVRVSELVPRLAARSDKYTLIRSNRNFNGDHTKAGTIALTGNVDTEGTVWPNFGSIVGRHRGTRELPPFMSLGRGIPRDVNVLMKGYGGGTWGKMHDPFMVSCSDEGNVDIPSLKLFDGLTPTHLDDRRRLLSALDENQRQLDSPEIRKWHGIRERAYSLLTAPEARKAFDLSREDEKTRASYGQSSFGQSCLLARRLVQAGMPYVQVNWSQYVETMSPNCDFGWDTHIYNFEQLPDRHCPIFDRAFSALLDDLEQRGLLKTTLVVALGEFGRSPRITPQAARDHWHQCYFSLWAGAGIEGGRVLGESDKLGQEPITDPVTPLMVGTSIMELAGLDTQARAELGVLPNGHAIPGLF